MKKILSLIFVILCISMNNVFGAAPTRVATYTSGAVISNTDVTSNEDAIFTYLQGGVDVIKDNTIVAADIQDSAVTTSKILDGTIANADISSSAAIAYSKLDLSTSITGSDLASDIAITTTGTTTTSGLSVSGFLKDKDGDVGVSGQILTSVNGQTDWGTSVALGYTNIAWIKFVGATGVISDSYNVTNVTDNGAGDMTVNFSITFGNANYGIFLTISAESGVESSALIQTQTTTTARIYSYKSESTTYDPTTIYLLALGD